MASTALTPKTARDLLESRKQEFAKALVNRIDPEAFIRVAHMAMSKTPALLECTPGSLLMALMESASLGLMPNGVLGHAYIIPYRNRGVMEAQFQPGYRGLIDLARRSGAVKSIVPRTVTSTDRFEVEYGLDEKLLHIPDLDNPGSMRFVYAVAHLTDGGTQFHIMPIKDVDRIRARSKAANSGPWVTDYEAMAWKTVIKQLIKFLPLSLEADTAIQQDNAAEFGGDVPTFGPSVPERALPQPESRTEQLRGRVAARQIAPSREIVQEAPLPPVAEPAVEPEAEPAVDAYAVEDGPELNEFENLVDALTLEGGDANARQRKELRRIGEDLYGAGTDWSETVRELSENEDLGKAQVVQLISAGSAALRARQPATTTQAADPFGEEN
jgi:recombination protein RecT